MVLIVPVAAVIALAAAYLAGSIPFGLVVARFAAGIDPREHGSRNIGATNIARTLGMKWGLVVLVLDALKGALPTWWLPPLLTERPDLLAHLAVGCGLSAICGHMFPCWLGFKGGKGVATSLGVAAVLQPWATLVAFAAFAATIAVWRIVSLSSIVATLAFAVVALASLWPAPFSAAHWSSAAFALAAPLLIIVRHRSNLGRLWRGEEQRFRSEKGATAPAPDR